MTPPDLTPLAQAAKAVVSDATTFAELGAITADRLGFWKHAPAILALISEIQALRGALRQARLTMGSVSTMRHEDHLELLAAMDMADAALNPDTARKAVERSEGEGKA